MRLCFSLLCLVAALVPFLRPLRPQPVPAFAGWPATFEGESLARLPLTPAELRFSERFPGQIALFTDGRRRLIARWIATPTRQLHASGDCFRGLGYRITETPLILDRQGQRWSTFIAERGPVTLHARERIQSTSASESWTDVSAWYWSALCHPQSGPWLALTVIE